MIPVIICGGFGTKLWPLSRQLRPKHFLPLMDGKSLFQLNYEALLTKFDPSEIYVSTNKDQVKLAQLQVPQIPDDNFILEPEMKNTGPAIGLIAAVLHKKGFKDVPFFLVQADVLRKPTDLFIKMVEECGELAKTRKEYITGGIRPKTAVMGVDYLLKGQKVNDNEKVGVYKVDKFVWRVSEEETNELIKNSNILIHSNHTCMTPENYIQMYKKYRLDWYEPLENIINGADINSEFSKMSPDPQEKVTQLAHEAGESLIVELPFEWYDFGTFKSLSEYLKDNNIYSTGENIIDLDGKNNYINLDDTNKVVALVGVDNLIVVDTGDALLICEKSMTGQVGEALKEVKSRKLSLT
jgi:mannose-1-phosphate guanylyltransferase